MAKEPLKLKAGDRKKLKNLTHSGTLQARKMNRCRILLLAAEGKKRYEIAEIVGVALVTVDAIRRRYEKEGLKSALNERPRSGAPVTFTGKHKAQITALACSCAPEGNSRWSMRLLADRAVELKLVKKVSYVTVSRVLKKMN